MLGLKSNYGDIICNLNKNSLRCFLFFLLYVKNDFFSCGSRNQS